MLKKGHTFIPGDRSIASQFISIMSLQFQLKLITNTLIELGHAPVAGLLKNRVCDPQSNSHHELLAHIQLCVKNSDYEALLNLFTTSSLELSLDLSTRERAIGRYVVLRFMLLKLVLDIQLGQNSVTPDDVDVFFLSKLTPALNNIQGLAAIPILSHLAEDRDYSLSLLLKNSAYEGADPAAIFTSSIMLIPIKDDTFNGMTSGDECLNYVLSYVLPESLSLWPSSDDSKRVFSKDLLTNILNEASWHRLSHSPYYLPSRLAEQLETVLIEDVPAIEQKMEQNFPIQNLFTLSDHKDEVWFVKFSPSGRFLATGSLDDTCILYDVLDNFRTIAVLSPTIEDDEVAFLDLSFKPALDKKKGVICISWEPHERYIVVCCLDTVIRVWNVEHLTLTKRVTRLMDEPLPKLVTCFSLGEGTRTWPCEFLETDSEKVPRFIVGSPDKVLKAFTVDGVEVLDFYSDTEEWQKALEEEIASNATDEESTSVNNKNNASQFNRINDLAISPNGKFLVSANNDKQVFFYEIPDLSNPSAITKKIGLLSLSGRLTSCNISASGKYMLLSIAPELLQVWDISPLERGEKPFLKSKLLGLSQALFMIRSCFGYLTKLSGAEELVLSGSDDGCIYIWRLETGQLITRVRGHEGLCNSVDWNRFYVPQKNGIDYGTYWASVGDDKLVQIWGPKR